MENPDSDPNAPSPVPVAIPSAVRSTSSWNSLVVLALAALALMVVFLFKGRPRHVAESTDATNTLNGYAPSSEGSLPLQAIQAMTSPNTSSRETGESLRDVRRKSPMLLFNGGSTSASAAATSGDSDTPNLPMPNGFRPSKAVNSHSTALGDRECVIAQGKLIDAVLETAINTDQPGMLRALVSNDIYGDTGRTVLLPRGSRLIGQYDSNVARGQSRIFVIWQRVIRPDGIDIALDSGGTDALGQAGVTGQVNNHFFAMFSAATLLSIIGASTAAVGVRPQDNNNSLATYRSSVSQGFNDAASTVLGTFVRIKPTIKVRPGTAVKVFVARDLYFDPSQVQGERIEVIP
jgi:type IV secretory pathway VirB10-like protein